MPHEAYGPPQPISYSHSRSVIIGCHSSRSCNRSKAWLESSAFPEGMKLRVCDDSSDIERSLDKIGLARVKAIQFTSEPRRISFTLDHFPSEMKPRTLNLARRMVRR